MSIIVFMHQAEVAVVVEVALLATLLVAVAVAAVGVDMAVVAINKVAAEAVERQVEVQQVGQVVCTAEGAEIAAGHPWVLAVTQSSKVGCY